MNCSFCFSACCSPGLRRTRLACVQSSFRTPGDLQHVPRLFWTLWCCLWHLSAFPKAGLPVSSLSIYAPMWAGLRVNPGSGISCRWSVSVCPLPLPLQEPSPLHPRHNQPQSPALSPGILFQLSCCPHLPSDHHVCPYHDSLQPKELRTGLYPTGSVFMDVLKPPGSSPEQLIRSECCREQNRSSGSLWRKRMQEQTQSLISALQKHKWELLLQCKFPEDWYALAGQSEWGGVTFRLDLVHWIGVSRDVCGLRGVYDLHLYTLHP